MKTFAEVKSFLIYENEVNEKNIIGNLELEVAKTIHRNDISFINEKERYIIVKKLKVNTNVIGSFLLVTPYFN